jgi:hypothetical protein
MFAVCFPDTGTEELLRIIVVQNWSLPFRWSLFMEWTKLYV